jgi:hypothetical protein
VEEIMKSRMRGTSGGKSTEAWTGAGVDLRVHRLPLATLALCAQVLACHTGIAMAAEPGAGAERWPVMLGVGSELWIEGTSTLHPWSSRTDSLGLAFRVAPGTARPADVPGLAALVRSQAVRGGVLEVPVRGLRSKESCLDKNLWRALRSDEYPTVRFEMRGYGLIPMRPGSDTLAALIRGVLVICGRERPVELEGLLQADAGGMWLVGREDLLMSDFGIRPPTMMLGTLRVGDRVEVHYRLLLVPGIAGIPAAAVSGDEKGVRE